MVEILKEDEQYTGHQGFENAYLQRAVHKLHLPVSLSLKGELLPPQLKSVEVFPVTHLQKCSALLYVILKKPVPPAMAHPNVLIPKRSNLIGYLEQLIEKVEIDVILRGELGHKHPLLG